MDLVGRAHALACSAWLVARDLFSVTAAACAARAPEPARPGTARACGRDGWRPAAAATARRRRRQVRPRSPRRRRPSEEDIKRLSHELLDAYDRGDVAAVEPRLAPELLHFEGGHGTTRDEELAQLRKRKPGSAYIASRTWEEERVRGPRRQRGVHRQGQRAAGRQRREGAATSTPAGTCSSGYAAATRGGSSVDVAARRRAVDARHLERDLPQRPGLRAHAEPAARRDREGTEAGRRARRGDGPGPQRAPPRARPAGRSPASTSPTRARGSRAKRRPGASSRSRRSTSTSTSTTSARTAGTS